MMHAIHVSGQKSQADHHRDGLQRILSGYELEEKNQIFNVEIRMSVKLEPVQGIQAWDGPKDFSHLRSYEDSMPLLPLH